MARGVARTSVFFNDDDRAVLLNKVNLGLLIVHAFCPMRNHIHSYAKRLLEAEPNRA